MSVGRKTTYIIVTSAGATYEQMYYACVISLGSGSQTHYLERRTRGGGKKGREEGKKKRAKKREGKSEEKKMSRESDHAPRLGKLVDSPSSFERRKRLLRLKKN